MTIQGAADELQAALERRESFMDEDPWADSTSWRERLGELDCEIRYQAGQLLAAIKTAGPAEERLVVGGFECHIR